LQEDLLNVGECFLDGLEAIFNLFELVVNFGLSQVGSCKLEVFALVLLMVIFDNFVYFFLGFIVFFALKQYFSYVVLLLENVSSILEVALLS
jgi:hypothetical protein